MTDLYAIDWNDLTDGQRSKLNEYAYADAANRVRQTMARYGADADAAKAIAEVQLNLDMTDNSRAIKRAQRTRATKSDKRSAEFAIASNYRLSLESGFIWDVEV